MNSFLVTFLVVLIGFILIKSIIKFSLKLVCAGIFAVIAGFTVWICTSQPDMHKPFSLNTIEYLLKINKDGSVTTTKQITQTVYKNEGEGK